MRTRWRYAVLLLFTLPLGLAIRFAPIRFPPTVSKYGGSALWAVAIFWGVSLLLPRSSTALRTGLASLLAFGIEFFKLVRSPALDSFRLTLPGKLVLGRFFSMRDLFAYTVAILCAAAFDRAAFLRSPSARRAIR